MQHDEKVTETDATAHTSPEGNLQSQQQTAQTELNSILPVVGADPNWRKRALALILITAWEKRKDFASKTKRNVWFINIATALQVILAALVTGLSSSLEPTMVGPTTTALGAVATLSAAYLARMHTSDEPELSIQRIDRLDRFIRECRVFEFQLNASGLQEINYDAKLNKLRQTLENILRHPTAPPPTRAAENGLPEESEP